MRDFKTYHGLAENVRDRVAVNTAIRKNIPGGNEVLDVIERLTRMLHGRARPDPALQDMLDNLHTARNKMADVLIAGFLASHGVPAVANKKSEHPLADDHIK
jgi:hypothetical protein